jgi:benzodiazapine receptor
MMFEWLVMAGFGAAAMAAASTGALFQPGDWYEALDKPSWTPPNWLFPVAWMILYIAMVVAAWRMALSGHPLAPLGVALWAAQMTFNALWSPVFFGLQRLGAAFVVIVGLWTSVALTLLLAVMIDGIAAWLLVPYLVWVSYAAALNLRIWRTNELSQPS